MKQCFVFDIDGTLADLRHRLHFIQKYPKDWDGFFLAVSSDAPILHVIKVCCTLGLGTPIILSSSRPERTREATIGWLIKHNIQQVVHKMYMRQDGDHRPDFQVKREMLGADHGIRRQGSSSLNVA